MALSASVHASADVKAEACAAATVEVPAWVRHVETLRLSDHDDNHVTRAIIASAEAGELGLRPRYACVPLGDSSDGFRTGIRGDSGSGDGGLGLRDGCD